LWQSATPDKTIVDSPTSKPREKFALHKLSSTRSASCRRLLASAKQSSSQKSPRSSASKRSPSSEVSPGSDMVNGHEAESPALTTATLRSPLRSPRRTMNGNIAATDSHDLSPTKTSEVSQRSPEVTDRSPKLASRSPKVVTRTPELSRSPRQRQLFSGSSNVAIKRGRTSSPGAQLSHLLTPEGQPRTKKFIVERLRNAKTSRRNIATTCNKSSSPSRKSPQPKVIGK